MKMKSPVLLGFILSVFAHLSYAEITVIVHPSNDSALTQDEISRIFLGKNRAFPNGSEALPVAFAEGVPEGDEFTQKVLSKTPKQLKAYWAKMIFTGKGTPPKEMPDSKSVLELVASNPNIIGFVASGTENASVKAVGKY